MIVKRVDRKICFAASSGGHIEEISRLRGLVKVGDFVVTESSSYSVVDWCDKTYYVDQINRKERFFIFKFLKLACYSFKILIEERPEYIISTGALATIPICLLGKLVGAKVIYIESFARVKFASMTGKLMYKIADLFIVQWKELLKLYPKAKYGGSIF